MIPTLISTFGSNEVRKCSLRYHSHSLVLLYIYIYTHACIHIYIVCMWACKKKRNHTMIMHTSSCCPYSVIINLAYDKTREDARHELWKVFSHRKGKHCECLRGCATQLWMINVEIESCGIIVTGSVYAWVSILLYIDLPLCY